MPSSLLLEGDLVSLNQGTRGHPQTLTLGVLYLSLRGGGGAAAMLTRGIERRDDTWFPQAQLVDFSCLERGCFGFPVSFFLPGTGAVQRE